MASEAKVTGFYCSSRDSKWYVIITRGCVADHVRVFTAANVLDRDIARRDAIETIISVCAVNKAKATKMLDACPQVKS